MMRELRGRVLAVAALAACATMSASADDLSYLGMTGGGVSMTAAFASSSDVDTWAGRFDWHNETTGDDFAAYCIELTEYTSGSPQPYTEVGIGTLMTATRASALAELFENHGAQAMHFDSPGSPSNDDLREAAAMQMAIWELVYETYSSVDDFDTVGPGAIGVEDGELSFAGRAGSNSALFADARSMAQDWLEELDGVFDAAWLDRIRGLHNDGHQDQVIMVPVPAPALLAGLGLLGVVAARRRFA